MIIFNKYDEMPLKENRKKVKRKEWLREGNDYTLYY